MNKNEDVINLSRERLKKALKKLQTESLRMNPSDFSAFFLLEIMGPLLEPLEKLYGAELNVIEDRVNNIHHLILSLLQNQAKIHYRQVYQPLVKTRIREIEDDKSQQAHLFDTSVYNLAKPIATIIPPQPVVNKNSTTKLRGVKQSSNGYISHIWSDTLRRPNKKSAQQFLGRYPDPVFAALVRDAAAQDLHGENAKLNFQIVKNEFPILFDDNTDE